jgi:hypothetical protein
MKYISVYRYLSLNPENESDTAAMDGGIIGRNGTRGKARRA